MSSLHVLSNGQKPCEPIWKAKKNNNKTRCTLLKMNVRNEMEVNYDHTHNKPRRNRNYLRACIQFWCQFAFWFGFGYISIICYFFNSQKSGEEMDEEKRISSSSRAFVPHEMAIFFLIWSMKNNWEKNNEQLTFKFLYVQKFVISCQYNPIYISWSYGWS